jgi:anaerobic magnesium-protoporphyrin IX monomethyl ester cyclase
MNAQSGSQIDVLLVGYENQENLGLRSILAYLRAHGYRAELAPFTPGNNDAILAAIRIFQPRLIGFSLIFQYTLDEFGRLMHELRQNDIRAHFTAGGHFPSLRPAETLTLLPELDSVVRFEGELTLLELLAHLDRPDEWHLVRGLAFRSTEQVKLTPTRPLIDNLDSLPLIYRDKPRLAGDAVPMVSMLASRGCLFNCSFCSIRQFYGGTSGALRRSRAPQAVVDEMQLLFNEKGVRLFIFQDDDFAARTPRQRQWLQDFLGALDATKLANQVRWKISCRVDDLEPGILEAMLVRGLVAVYLGVESGSERGLRTLNKHVAVAQNHAAIELIKRYNVALAIGFMLFDPSSTVETVRENLAFLRSVGTDGYFPINFCKMLPYAGTPIEAELRVTGRLKGTIIRPDYDFSDPQLDWYAFMVHRIFTRRNFNAQGTVARLQQADFDQRLSRALGCPDPLGRQEADVRRLSERSNIVALETLETLLDEVVSRGAESLIDEQQQLIQLAEREWRCEVEIEAALDAIQGCAPLTNTLAMV